MKQLLGFNGSDASLNALCALVLFMLPWAPPGYADPATEIDGTWTVVSVEYGGQKLDGFAGAKLTLERGVTSFTLPGGEVQRGTYKLDAGASPKRIDTTSDGKVEAPRGIYELQGQTLRMCFNQTGAPPPTQFRTAPGEPLLLMVVKRQPVEAPKPGSDAAGTAASAAFSGTRPFYMGFTAFPFDITIEAVTSTRQFVREHGDLICHHVEGVPWTEALRDELTPATMQRLRGDKKAMAFPGAKVYLALSPGRGELKPDDKSKAIPAELQGKLYDHPLVKQAYLTYCRRSIEFFRPDYLAIGIETNEMLDGGPLAWAAYTDLHRHVYQELKKDHPDLPIFASFTLHNLYKKRGAMLAAWKELMPYNDLVAVSYYPFFIGGPQRLGALDWLCEEFDAFDKPYAIAETNEAAQPTPFEFLGQKFNVPGSPQAQVEYYSKLLSLAGNRRFEFVVSFIHQDYDAMWAKIQAYSPSLFGVWRDCGLLDESGRARPVYELWRDYFRLPIER